MSILQRFGALLYQEDSGAAPSGLLITQADVEVLKVGSPAIKVTQADVEVLMSLSSSARNSSFFLFF